MNRQKTKANFRSQRGSASIAEFGAVFIAIILCVLIPLANLAIIGSGAALRYALSVIALSKAANATTFSNGLASLESTNAAHTTALYLQLAKFKPVGGYKNTGMDLQAIATNRKTNEAIVSSPNSPWTKRIDTSKEIYEYSLRTTFEMGPYCASQDSTLVKSLPVLGHAVQLSFSMRRFAEHPSGLSN